jgi:hypothetical protein
MPVFVVMCLNRATPVQSYGFLLRIALEGSHALTNSTDLVASVQQKLQDSQSLTQQLEQRLHQAREAEQSHRTLYPLAIMLASVSSNRDLVSALHRHGPSILRVSTVSLFLLDGTTNELVSQLGDTQLDASRPRVVDVRVPLADSLLGAVASSGEVSILSSPATDARWHDTERSALRVRSLSTMLLSPVTDVTGLVQGMLVLSDKAGETGFVYADQAAAGFLSAFISSVLYRLHHPKSTLGATMSAPAHTSHEVSRGVCQLRKYSCDVSSSRIRSPLPAEEIESYQLIPVLSFACVFAMEVKHQAL